MARRLSLTLSMAKYLLREWWHAIRGDPSRQMELVLLLLLVLLGVAVLVRRWKDRRQR